jgi:hypothetical protein
METVENRRRKAGWLARITVLDSQLLLDGVLIAVEIV